MSKFLDSNGVRYLWNRIVSSTTPLSRKINNKSLSTDITLTAEDVGAVPTSRTVNGKPLDTAVILTAADVKARPDTWMPSAADTGAATMTQVNGAISAAITTVLDASY